MSEAEPPFELVIEKIVAGGDGLGRSGKRVVFVPGTIPSEIHLVAPVDKRRDFVRARSTRLLKSAKSRREPPCPHYGECGGCALMHLSTATQLTTKRDILMETLKRIAKIEFDGHCELIPSPEDGYRSRVRFHYAERRLGLVRRRSNELAPIGSCLQISEALNRLRVELELWLQRDADIAPWLWSVELQEPSALVEKKGNSSTSGKSGQNRGCVASFVVSQDRGRWFDKQGHKAADRLARALAPMGIRGIGIGVDGRRGFAVSGDGGVAHELGGFVYRQSIGSFFQSNRFLLDRLVERVLPVSGGPVSAAYDLHCGVGLFSLPLSRRARKVYACDASAQAISDAKENARTNGIDNVEFTHEPAARLLQRATDSGIDWLVLDPPRGGLSKEARAAVVAKAPNRIRYVSCDAATFARDARELVVGGYRLRNLVLLDLFPNTHHFETVAEFGR